MQKQIATRTHACLSCKARGPVYQTRAHTQHKRTHTKLHTHRQPYAQSVHQKCRHKSQHHERTMLESKRTREACKQANCSKKVSRVFSKFGEGTSLGTPCQVPNRRQPYSFLHLSRLVNSHTHHRAEKRRPQHKNQIHIKKIDRVPIKSPPEIKL